MIIIKKYILKSIVYSIKNLVLHYSPDSTLYLHFVVDESITFTL